LFFFRIIIIVFCLQLIPELSSNITRWIEQYLQKLEQNLSQTDPSDGSVYTGHAGIALLYTRLASLFQDKRSHYMSKAKSLIDLALRQLDGKNCRFEINFLKKSK